MVRVFIDGSAGTTGLRIHSRLREREDISLVELPEDLRKDPSARQDALRSADIAFLCLPDEAAREAVSLVGNAQTAIIDTSTAHRTAQGWAYGFPELQGRREEISHSRRIANPGCHASGFIALTEPLVRMGVLKRDVPLTCFSLTGYSGGGKKMIAQYEAPQRDPLLEAPRMYGISQQHKHLPEMVKISGLAVPPIFCPIVAPFYSGMEVTVPLFGEWVTGGMQAVREIYADYYSSGLVHFCPEADESGMLSAAAFAGRDDMQITVCGNEERMLLAARFDNLGKGASGAAIQNMNLLLGLDESTGLNVL
jgi:N-acetyl-gamma-glutamyl-phosphate reductase